MLELRATLTGADLEAIVALEHRVISADGGRLKLELNTLRSRSGEDVTDLLWSEDGRLLGFLGLYGYGTTIELAGMVDPTARRRGIASALLDAALPLCRDRGARDVLLIVPRPSAPGKALALARDGTLDHAEHALVLRTTVPDIPHDGAVLVRTAVPQDAARVGELLEVGFGFTPSTEPDDRTLVVERDGDVIGTLRVVPTDAGAGIYGFVIDTALRGRGIGRDVLSRVCADALGRGAAEVRLEVAVDNDHALGLYTSLGFRPHITEDYYRLKG